MDRKEIIDSEYSTQNLYEAAYLLYRGFDLAGRETVGTKTNVHFMGKVEEPILNENGQLVGKKVLKPREVGIGYYKSEAKKIMECYRTMKDYAYKEKYNN